MTQVAVEPGRRSSLKGLLVAQFLGAFLDNAWKLFLACFLIRTAANQGEASDQQQTTLAFVVFTLPLMLGSLPACRVADRVSKRTLLVGLKGVEFGILALLCVAVAVAPEGRLMPLVALGLLGLQSAFFSPAKYGILPELVSHERLSVANGLLEMWTFLAVIAGTASGGLLATHLGDSPVRVVGLCVGLSAIGFLAALRIPRTPGPAAAPGTGSALWASARQIRRDRVLGLAVAGSVVFYLLASLLGQDVMVYARNLVRDHASADTLASLPIAVFGLGVGAGSMLAGRLSARRVESGLLPLGGLGMAFAVLWMARVGPHLGGTLAACGLLGVAGGLVIVPLNALLQWRAPAELRGGIIALSNFFVFGGVLVGSLAAGWLARAGWSAQDILLAAGLVTVAATGWAFWLVPQAFLRCVLLLLTHTFYRVHLVGRAHVPEVGPALLLPNHVSFIDGLLLIATNDRDVRFLVDEEYYRRPLLRFFLKALGAIPISSQGGTRVVLRALRQAGEYLDQGELVCLFPEGQLTRTGSLLPFRRGLERLVKGRDVPLIPVHLDRVWGSIFSRSGGRFLTKLPEKIPYPVTVSYGVPLPAGTPLWEIRQRVLELGHRAWEARRPGRRPLHRAFRRRARRRPWATALVDGDRRCSRLALLAGAVALARQLRPAWGEARAVGILLPPGLGGALANLAAALAGRASVNLNHTAGPAAMASALRQAGVTSVLTSRRFLAATGARLPDPVQVLDLEEEMPGRAGRMVGGLLALLAPARLLERACGARRACGLDDVVTILFSSGTTGEPKGVPLTHFNLDSNIEGTTQVLAVRETDSLLGVLPLFHAFGTMSLWFALTQGMKVVCHPNPMDAPAIGDLVERHRITVMLATPTFLNLYRRRCTPGQFGSVRLLVTGAEKLSPELARAFRDEFGLQPLEGYGSTECAPVIAVSAPDFRAPGFFQRGSRPGYVGQPLPGVQLRVVDPDAPHPEEADSLPPDTPGLLLVRGPNVMRGYLGRPEQTAEVLRDGWYVTGDIAQMDEDGFLAITDRLSRFSKIGGEMVPHGVVEQALQEASGRPDPVLCVTSVPDDRKGEQLAVVHTLGPDCAEELLQRVRRAGLPPLFLPRPERFVPVDSLPLLGSGKVDLRRVREIALAAAAERPPDRAR